MRGWVDPGSVPEIALCDRIDPNLCVYHYGDGDHAPSLSAYRAEQPKSHVRRPDLSLDDLLGFVVELLRLSLDRVIGELGRL